MNMSDVQDCLASPSESEDCELAAAAILSLMAEETFTLTVTGSSDDTIIYYIAGYVAKRASRNMSCQSCLDEVCASSTSPQVRVEENEEAAGKDLSQRFLTQVSRGGLMHPSENVFLFCIMTEKVRENIFGDTESKKLFLSCAMQKDVFMSILSNVFSSIGTFPHICKDGHPLQKFWKMAGAAYVNCFIKNLTSETNDFLHAGRKRLEKGDPGARKIRKLQSCSSK